MKNNDCATLVGVVIKTKKDLAFVERTRLDACNGCKGCALGKGGNKIVLPTKNLVGAKKGDTVEFSQPPEKPLFAILALFIIPLLLMIVGLIVPYALKADEIISLACGIVGVALGFVTVMLFDRLFYSKKYIASILKIFNTDGENND